MIITNQSIEEMKKKLFTESEAALIEWKAQYLKDVEIPNRYKPNSDAILTPYRFATRINPDTEAIWIIMDCLYAYGFKRGMAYANAQNKKKAALHAANMKDGTECPADD